MDTDGSGFLQNNGGMFCANSGGIIEDVVQIQITMALRSFTPLPPCIFYQEVLLHGQLPHFAPEDGRPQSRQKT